MHSSKVPNDDREGKEKILQIFVNILSQNMIYEYIVVEFSRTWITNINIRKIEYVGCGHIDRDFS